MKFLSVCLVSMWSVMVFGQSYQPGLIVTTSLDTIFSYVPYTNSFGEEFDVLTMKDSLQQTVHIDDLRYLATERMVYESITYQVRNKEKKGLLAIIEEGRINLYAEIVENYYRIGDHSRMHNSYNSYYERIYVVKKADQVYHVRNGNFSEVIAPLIADAPDVIRLMKRRHFKFKNLERIIRQYNESFTKE